MSEDLEQILTLEGHEIGPELRRRREMWIESPQGHQGYKTHSFMTCELHNSDPRGPIKFCEGCCEHFKPCLEWAKAGYPYARPLRSAYRKS